MSETSDMDNPQKRDAAARRPDGTFGAGNKANPGGRPKGYADFRAKCREHTDASIATLVAALGDERLCVQAAQTLLSYGWGKPQSAPEDLDAVASGPSASRELVLAALERLAKGGE